MPLSERRFYHYNPAVVTGKKHVHLPGMRRFASFFRITNNPNGVLIDRNHVVRTPVRTQVYLTLPSPRPNSKSYEEICNERAVQLLAHAERLNLPIYLFYSGGIDSTLVLVSLLKNAKPGQLDRLILLLTKDSIGENPTFYDAHIRNRIKQKVAIGFPFLFSKRAIFISGEFNDQLFGSDQLRDFINFAGPENIHAKFNPGVLGRFWSTRLEDKQTLNWYLDLCQSIKSAAPIPIESNADFLWWFGFTLKWQSVFMRFLTYASDLCLNQIDREFVENNFFLFFGTDEFQQWSMANNDKKIGNSWSTYKQLAKQLIYEFHKDRDYLLHKTKRSSLYWIIAHQSQKNFVTDDFALIDHQDPEIWYNPDNSFL